MNRQQWVRFGPMAVGFLVIAGLLVWLLREGGRRAPQSEVVEFAPGQVDPQRVAPQRPGLRDPANPTPVFTPLASINLPPSALAPARLYVPIALLPDDMSTLSPQEREALNESEKQAAAAAALAGRGPRHVMAIAPDARGNLWVGSEMEGVYRYETATRRWTQFTPNDGLGDNYAYAVAVDRMGRVWVGHLGRGVSVHNGQEWRNYEVIAGASDPASLAGPLGGRIFDIAVCPTDGDVWMATSLGLARYSEARDEWSYYTRLDGLPSDQANAIAFDAEGNIYVGMQCDGLAIALAREGYKTWRPVVGPLRMPTVSRGSGLPSSMVNDVLVMRDNTLLVATTHGVAESRDYGRSFAWYRGSNWSERVRAQPGGAPAGWWEQPGAVYVEDDVACLAEGADGVLWLGYRQKGFEAVNAKTGRRVPLLWSEGNEFVRAIVAGTDGCFVGTYGGGMLRRGVPALPIFGATPPTPRLPASARPPQITDLEALAARLRSLPPGNSPAAYLGDDWITQGDWTGRYGRQYAVLCAAVNEPISLPGEPYAVQPRRGPGAVKPGVVNHIVSPWTRTDDPRALWCPNLGYRRLGEWNDHGSPPAADGDDVWVRITVPQGMHRVSLYFANKDGREGENRNRNYQVLIRPFDQDMIRSLAAPPLAQTRVGDFWGSVYKQFLLRGPGDYFVQVRRCWSLNTIVSGVFIDKLSGPATANDARPRAFMGGVAYDRPPAPELQGADSALRKADELWKAGERLFTEDPASAALGTAPRVLAYRAAQAAGAPADLLANWRWTLPLWTREDREAHNKTMLTAWEAQRKAGPAAGGRP